jgi:predicted 3-demethylubiquinone-9 3-methyltransferase (glyoxalase superfamily)
MSPATTKRKPAKKAASKRAKPTASIQQISPCLWFDGQAEEAARFYVSVFPKGKITQVTRYPEVGQEVHHRPAGSVMTVEFVLNGLPFLALNGGPLFKFNEAVSLMILCDTQDEIDYYWDKLSEGGDPSVQACGWLKDKYGLSWQVVPREEMKLWKDHKSPATRRAFAAMMDMKKLDIAKLTAAYKGK